MIYLSLDDIQSGISSSNIILLLLKVSLRHLDVAQTVLYFSFRHRIRPSPVLTMKEEQPIARRASPKGSIFNARNDEGTVNFDLE